MKYLMPLFLILVSEVTVAQRTYDDTGRGLLDRKTTTVDFTVKPKKGDTYIFISGEPNLLDVAKSLMALNYEIDKVDSSLNFVTTQPKSIPGINGEYYIRVVKVDREYKIVGMARFNFTPTLAGIVHEKGAFEPAGYTKSKGSDRRVFDAAYDAASRIGVVKRYEK